MTTAAEQAAASKPRAAADETKAEPGKLKAGQFVQMQNERWFRCGDLNQKLNASLSRIAILADDCNYDHLAGIDNGDCKTFTVRQFYANGNPTLDYSADSVQRFLADIAKHVDELTSTKLRGVLGPGLREFEKQYKAFDEETLFRQSIR
jgi:hypothetical protein